MLLLFACLIAKSNSRTFEKFLIIILLLHGILNYLLTCVASVSVRFWSRERRRKGIFGFDRARNEMRAKKWKRGEGEGKGKEGDACRQTPRSWKPAFASKCSAWLAWLVEQYWHMSIKGLFHTERSCMVRDMHINFLWLLFILVGKICPPMQEHFVELLLKRKALLVTI